VGKSPHPSLARLAADPRVTVTGYVADILPYFGGADVYIVPLRIGGGTRLKVLEAMSAGLPLVSTTVGAEGIALQSGRDAVYADDAAAFSQAVLRLLGDPALRAEMGLAARGYVVAHYDWRAIAPLLEPLYDAAKALGGGS
jgi:glycosyltransferase involved in cell wall biosynthesis